MLHTLTVVLPFEADALDHAQGLGEPLVEKFVQAFTEAVQRNAVNPVLPNVEAKLIFNWSNDGDDDFHRRRLAALDARKE